MIKALPAIAIFSFIAAAVFVLPGFAPPVEAQGPVALQKSNRLVVHTVDRGCTGQTWPNFSGSCLYGNGAKPSRAWSVPTAANRKVSMTSPAVRSETQIDHGC